jgi:hypothetical protein
VGEEGKSAQDDPGTQKPGGDRQDQDLAEAALDEGELERIEDGDSLMRMNPVCILAVFRRRCHSNQTEIGLSTLRYRNRNTQ